MASEMRRKAIRIAETYFDSDIETADAAFDVLVDNGVEAEVAREVAQDCYPAVDGGSRG